MSRVRKPVSMSIFDWQKLFGRATSSTNSESLDSIRHFVNAAITKRESELPGLHTPSAFWRDFNKYSRYVRSLPDEELRHIRLHTWHLNGDMYPTYIFRPEIRQQLIDDYEQYTSLLNGFRPSEADNGIGFDTEFGQIGIDICRYLLPLRDMSLAKVISRTQAMQLLEIGGGYGGLARLCLLFNPKSAIVICDLEETLFFQAVFLTQCFGSSTVHLLETADTIKELRPGHIYLIPQHAKESLRKLHFDIVINQQSLQEMTQEQVTSYCDLIADTSDYFYSCNMPQHEPHIAEEKKIVCALTDYLKSRFTSIWTSEQAPVTQENRTVIYNDVLLDRLVFRSQ